MSYAYTRGSQKFYNIFVMWGQKSAALDAFAEVVNVWFGFCLMAYQLLWTFNAKAILVEEQQ